MASHLVRLAKNTAVVTGAVASTLTILHFKESTIPIGLTNSLQTLSSTTSHLPTLPNMHLTTALCESQQSFKRKPAPRHPGGQKKAGQPSFTTAQVAQRDGSDGNPMWVSYRDGVYNVTDFQNEHPGGNFILQAAGGPVDSFWETWYYHHGSLKVHKYLNELRIGTLSDWQDTVDATDTPYAEEPVRGDGQHVLDVIPWSSETIPSAMAASYTTKNEDFYVRNHKPVPVFDDEAQKEHSIEFDLSEVGVGTEPTDQTLGELLAKHKHVQITSILQCAGNRSADNIAANPVGSGFLGTPFEPIGVGMLGNATWGGVRITDIIEDLAPSVMADCKDWHIEFAAADEYYGSVPVSLLGPDCLLATEMNGVPLPADHGYPVRALLPGIAGARNVKWVTQVTLRRKESEAPWNAYYYKEGKPNAKISIYTLPLQSIILTPSVDQKVDPKLKTIKVTGIAFAGNGSKISQVKVSSNKGEDWIEAKLLRDEVPQNDSTNHNGWVRWECEIENIQGHKEICCRAIDETGLTQPEKGNVNGGYVYNGWHKLSLE